MAKTDFSAKFSKSAKIAKSAKNVQNPQNPKNLRFRSYFKIDSLFFSNFFSKSSSIIRAKKEPRTIFSGKVPFSAKLPFFESAQNSLKMDFFDNISRLSH